jgi:uncharacterized protein YjeT (DUF2065 family)
MNDLAVAIGLVLVIEGLIWALVPRLGRKLLEATAQTPDPTLRLAGALTVAVGVFIVWMVRGGS